MQNSRYTYLFVILVFLLLSAAWLGFDHLIPVGLFASLTNYSLVKIFGELILLAITLGILGILKKVPWLLSLLPIIIALLLLFKTENFFKIKDTTGDPPGRQNDSSHIPPSGSDSMKAPKQPEPMHRISVYVEDINRNPIGEVKISNIGGDAFADQYTDNAGYRLILAKTHSPRILEIRLEKDHYQSLDTSLNIVQGNIFRITIKPK